MILKKDELKNFHTHTALCHHAIGMPEDYAVQAEKDGCTALGFSDHCPYPSSRKDDFWQKIRMFENETPLYINSIKKATEIVHIPLYTGFECEWDKGYNNWYKDGLKGQYGAQYLVLGQHWVTVGVRHIYAMDIHETSLLHKYIDQLIEGMQTGLFSFVAHPDLILGGWKEWNLEIQSCMKEVIKAAEICNIPLEINGLGLHKNPVNVNGKFRFPYPVKEFWQLVSCSTVKTICNADAHDPFQIIPFLKDARNFANETYNKPLKGLFE